MTYRVVAVVVLTWNQRDLTLNCLESLAALDYPATKLQVIVVDNGSVDDTASAIHQQFPRVIVLENTENLGFAEGNNIGIRYALDRNVEYVMLLNNDTVVAPDMLRHLVSILQADDQIGITTPKIYYYDEPTRIWCAGAAINWSNGTTQRLRAEEFDDGILEPIKEVDFGSGCAICVRSSVIEEIGLLDPRFFIYYEETDWCVRASRAGYRCVYVPQGKVWHKVSSAMQEGSPRTAYYMARNVLLFLCKSLPGGRACPALAAALARELIFVSMISIHPRHRHRQLERNARLYGILDFFRGRFGKMPEIYVSTTQD